MRQDTNDTRTRATCWRVVDDCTDEGTRRREACGDKEGENKTSTSWEARHKSKKIVPGSQGVHSSKASRLCYKAELGTL